MKRFWKSLALTVSIVALLVIISGCGSNETSDKDSKSTETLKVAFNQPESHPQFKSMEKFGEEFNGLTDGAYDFEISPNEILGAQRETVELVQSGTIAMSIVGGSLLENINEDFSVFNLPYVFDSIDHQMSVVNDHEIVGDLYNSIEDDGIIVLGAFHGGVRNVYTDKHPINTPEDLNGLKIRVMESDTNVQMLKKMGGVGTPMGQGEVYTAIQSGVLDGGENAELIYNDLKHVEVAPYYSYTQHLMVPDYLIINADLFNSMSEEEQVSFTEEFSKAIDLEVELFAEEVESAKKELEENGAEFNDVDISVFQKEVEPLIEEKLTTDKAKELYDQVRAAVE